MIWDGSGLIRVEKMRLNLKYSYSCVLGISGETVVMKGLCMVVSRPRDWTTTRILLHPCALAGEKPEQDRAC